MMNSKAFGTAAGLSVILAVIGYFVGESLGFENAGFATGIILGGIVASLVASLVKPSATIAMDDDEDLGDSAPIVSGDAVTLFVGNLTHKTRRNQLEELFQPFGKVLSVRIALDRATRRSRGFGFVVMDKVGADAAIKSINGKNFYGRNLKVSIAKEQRVER